MFHATEYIHWWEWFGKSWFSTEIRLWLDSTWLDSIDLTGHDDLTLWRLTRHLHERTIDSPSHSIRTYTLVHTRNISFHKYILSVFQFLFIMFRTFRLSLTSFSYLRLVALRDIRVLFFWEDTNLFFVSLLSVKSPFWKFHFITLFYTWYKQEGLLLIFHVLSYFRFPMHWVL